MEEFFALQDWWLESFLICHCVTLTWKKLLFLSQSYFEHRLIVDEPILFLTFFHPFCAVHVQIFHVSTFFYIFALQFFELVLTFGTVNAFFMRALFQAFIRVFLWNKMFAYHHHHNCHLQLCVSRKRILGR